MLKKIVLSLVVLSVGILSADQLKLTDGSVLQGTITSVYKGKVKIKTDFAGELTIDADKVSGITTDAAVNVKATETESAASGKLTETGFAPTGAPVDLKTVTAIWPEGGKDPSFKSTERNWSYEISGDITGKTGNTTKAVLGLGAKATLTGPQDKLLMYVNAKHARENHFTNERNIKFGGDYERRIEKSRNSGYARSEYKYDRYNDLDPEWTNAAGYGLYVVDKDDVKVRLRLGLSYVYKDYISDKENDSSLGLDANYHHEIKLHKLGNIDNFATLVTDVTYTPMFEEFDNYRIYHESSLSLPLGSSKYWSIRLGISNDYYNQVAPTKERMDTTYFAKIVLTWE